MTVPVPDLAASRLPPAPPTPFIRAAALGGAVAVWLGVLVIAFDALGEYAATPASDAVGRPVWPSGSQLLAPMDLPVILMAAHPECPCTRASLEELARALVQAPGRARVTILFDQPADAPFDAETSALWASAAKIPGVEPRVDRDGNEARRFGLETSGHTVLYANDGTLRFSGGITRSRGHQGDNAGADALVARLLDGATTPATSRVFGCGLFNRVSR